MNQNKINIAVLGASGYTGGDLIKILLNHDYVNISALSANSKLGMNPSNVHASLFNAQLPDFVSLDEIDFTQIDLVNMLDSRRGRILGLACFSCDTALAVSIPRGAEDPGSCT